MSADGRPVLPLVELDDESRRLVARVARDQGAAVLSRLLAESMAELGDRVRSGDRDGAALSLAFASAYARALAEADGSVSADQRPVLPLVELSAVVAEQTRRNIASFGEAYGRLHVVSCARSLDDALTAGDLSQAGVVLAILRETVRALDAGTPGTGTVSP
jgi:hypothetical protein